MKGPGSLVKDQAMYSQIKDALQANFEIHAIYTPDESHICGDCYCAAVNLFSPGQTYRVYYKIDEWDQVQVQRIERWYFG